MGGSQSCGPCTLIVMFLVFGVKLDPLKEFVGVGEFFEIFLREQNMTLNLFFEGDISVVSGIMISLKQPGSVLESLARV